jgi:glycosyltransferase involved in cell wall biosynthesis
MNNIVIVSQVFYPNTISTSNLLTELALNIQDENSKISVICGFADGAEQQVLDRYENYHGIEIYRCGINTNSRAGILQRIISYICYLIHAGWKLIFFKGNNIIIGVTNPPFLCILLMIVSLINGCTYYFLMHDVYPEGLVAVGKLKEHSFVNRIWRKLNKLSYQRAKKLIVLGRDMADLLIEKYDINSSKIEYIPNWSLMTTEELIPFEKNDLAHELGIQDKFVVQYSGNMGLWHDIDTFILAADKLKTNLDIQFLFIGNGMRQKRAYQLAQKLELTNIIWMDFAPKDRLNTSLTCAHVALISLNSGLEGIAVPCKLYGILGSGKAIIAQVPAKSEVAYTILEEECGFVIPPGDVDELVNKIQQLEKDRELTSRMGLQSFHAYKSKYTIASISNKFQRVLGISVVQPDLVYKLQLSGDLRPN